MLTFPSCHPRLSFKNPLYIRSRFWLSSFYGYAEVLVIVCSGGGSRAYHHLK